MRWLAKTYMYSEVTVDHMNIPIKPKLDIFSTTILFTILSKMTPGSKTQLTMLVDAVGALPFTEQVQLLLGAMRVGC